MKNNLGKLIKETRIKKNMSKEDLANLLGVSLNTINRWEGNINKPSLSYLILLSKELDLSFDELVLGCGINQKNKNESKDLLKKIVKKNILYKNIFNVFAGIFVCVCLCFLEATLFKYNIASNVGNYIFILVIFMMCFVGFTELLEKSNLLEEKNKYKEYGLLLFISFVIIIIGFIIFVLY